MQLYRITQEAITNALRHSNADQVSVVLEPYANNKGVLLEIAIDVIGWSGNVGGGIRGMRERAISLGGYLKISKSQTAGTLAR